MNILILIFPNVQYCTYTYVCISITSVIFFFYFCDLKTASRVDKAGKAPLIPCDVPLASGPVDNIHLQLSCFGL